MNNHETPVDVWSRVLIAIALLLLLIYQLQPMSRASTDPGVLIPSTSSSIPLPDASRYPQPLPAWDNASWHRAAPSGESKTATVRHGGWVF